MPFDPFFRNDDDNTPQGKLARGCFYIVYFVVAMVLLAGIAHTIFD